MKKHKKVKAKRGWAMNVTGHLRSRAYVFHKKAGVFNVPVFVLPADADSYDAMVEQMAQCIQDHSYYGPYWEPSLRNRDIEPWARVKAQHYFAAIGITRPARKEDKP